MGMTPEEKKEKIRALINTIHINRANLQFIAENHFINGTMGLEIERVMTEYAELSRQSLLKELRDEIEKLPTCSGKKGNDVHLYLDRESVLELINNRIDNGK